MGTFINKIQRPEYYVKEAVPGVTITRFQQQLEILDP